ncbi:hypothetical protein N9C63_00505 [bacterium]|nr:hypothetical protein [bacterium]
MKILKANKTIEGYLTQSVNVNDLDYGHCAIDAPGYEKLVERIEQNGMIWPLIVNGKNIKFGNKRLLYARVNGYHFVDCVFETDISNLDKIGYITRIK